MSIIIGIVLGLIVAFAITSSMKAKMNTAIEKSEAKEYALRDTFRLTHQQDVFVSRDVDRTPRPKKDDKD